jgi:L-threonylcarbamoyladenylate synthase
VLVFDKAGIDRLYTIKERSNQKAIPVLIGLAEQLTQLTPEVPEFAGKLIDVFWPGALTLVVPARPELPDNLSLAATVGVRMPNLDLLCQLIARTGPLAATSANLSGMPNSITAEHVMAQLGDRIDLLLDGGATPGEIASTVVDCTGEQPRILRAGRIPTGALRAVLGDESGL